jgi:hypothetical protein
LQAATSGCWEENASDPFSSVIRLPLVCLHIARFEGFVRSHFEGTTPLAFERVYHADIPQTEQPG